MSMVDPAKRECRCEKCGHTDWVDGPLAPTPGIVCDVCRRGCPKCSGPMRPTHPEMIAAFDRGATNKLTPHEREIHVGVGREV